MSAQNLLFILILSFTYAFSYAQTEINESISEGEYEEESESTPAETGTPAEAEEESKVEQDIIGPSLPADYKFLKNSLYSSKLIPMNFDFFKSGGKLLPAKFIYSVSNKGLKIGPILFREKHLSLKIQKREKKDDLIITWPGYLPINGKILVYKSKANQVIFEKAFDKWDLGDELKKVRLRSKNPNNRDHYFKWQENDIDSDIIKKLKESEQVKLCVKFVGVGYRHSFCSEKSVSTNSNKEILFEEITRQTDEVFVDDKSQRPNGIIVVGFENEKLKFKANLANGMSVELLTKPLMFQIIDSTKTLEGELHIKATGATPFEDRAKIFEDGSWEATIKNFKLWVSGAGEIPFYQEFFVNQPLPVATEKLRIYPRSFLNTYANDTMIYGTSPPPAKITSVDGSANKYERSYYTWYVDRLKKGEVNKRNIGITYGDRNYQGIVDVYRGYQLEIGARLSGVAVVQNQELLLISDFVMSFWSETFFGSKNYWIGQQRWGLKAKYFRGLTKVNLLEQFTVTHLDIAYRLVPGIWERDATVGLLLSYQSVTLNADTVPMLGGGAFWARSMPYFFDKLFNIIPWFRHPKWVDAEVIYYLASSDTKYKLGTNFLVNFHGKMLMTPRFFIEGGASMRQTNYAVVGSGQTPLNASFLTGTLGVGYNF